MFLSNSLKICWRQHVLLKPVKSNKYYLFIILLVTWKCLLAFSANNIALISFLAKNVRNAVLWLPLNFISLSKSHELLIIDTWLTPHWKAVSSWLYFTNRNYHTAADNRMVFAIQWKISQKYSHIGVTRLNFRKSKAKRSPYPCRTSVETGRYLEIN